MGLLKKLDIFRSVNREQKEGTFVGAFLTFASLTLMFFFFFRELKEFKKDKLSTQLHVLRLRNSVILVQFDIVLFNLKCEHLVVGEEHSLDPMQIKLTDFGNTGCNLVGTYYMQPMDNKLVIRPDMQSTFIDLIIANAPGSGVHQIDFSHRINKFQFGRSISELSRLSASYPDLVKVNPLDGFEFHSNKDQNGHSVFLYELNIVGVKVNGRQEMIYHYNTNTINSQNIQPGLTFNYDFSAIGVAYNEKRSKNIFEFATYLFAIVGGILAIIKFLNTLIFALIHPSGKETESIIEM